MCGWCCVVGFLLGCGWFCVLLLGVSAWWNRGILDEVTKASFGRAVTGTAVMARSANGKKKSQQVTTTVGIYHSPLHRLTVWMGQQLASGLFQSVIIGSPWVLAPSGGEEDNTSSFTRQFMKSWYTWELTLRDLPGSTTIKCNLLILVSGDLYSW